MSDSKKIMRRAAKAAKTSRQLREDEVTNSFDLSAVIASTPLLADLRLTGYEDEMSQRLLMANHLMRKAGLTSLKPLLPLLLRLKGQPYTLVDHFPFEPFFRTRMPKSTTIVSGRQVSKCWGVSTTWLEGIDGQRILPKDLQVGMFLRAISDVSLRTTSCQVLDIFKNGVKPVRKLRLHSGLELWLTAEHRLRTTEKYSEVINILPGTPLATVVNNQLVWDNVESNECGGEDECWDLEVTGDRNYILNGVVSHNSTSLAAQGILFSNCIPYFSTLYLTPLFEMIRRFSQNYIRPFIETSPVRRLFSGSDTVNSVFQRSFKNQSQIICSFAGNSAERVRGVSADKCSLDELQDFDITHLGVIFETMSASLNWGIAQQAGTPKTLDNTLTQVWCDSSMAEWCITCSACNYQNIPAAEHDLIKMIGPWHAGISEECPGTICAKCSRPINPRTGRWVHRNSDKRWTAAGYHIPQVIMPMHYANAEKWGMLKAKQEGKYNTPTHLFYNEVCGEAYDAGARIVTVTDLKRAATLPWKREFEAAKARIGDYLYRVCAVDWGGGGVDSRGKANEKYRSYTAIAILGLLPNGQIHVIWGHRSLHPHEHVLESKLVIKAMSAFKCSHIVHDYTGAGSRQETIIRLSGLPLERIIPVSMTPACRGNIFQHVPETETHPRWYYKCDKPRSLSFTCQLIKSGVLKFFQYDYKGAEDHGLLHDFLNMIEDKSSKSGLDRYRILHDPAGPDDFAQAVNIGVMTICQMSNLWTTLSKYEPMNPNETFDDEITPATSKDWEN